MGDRRRSLFLVAVGTIVALAVVSAVTVGPPGQAGPQPEGNATAVVEVELAETVLERATGLSEHDSLEPGQGMLFVYANERWRSFHMRGMDFPLDIVFIGADGRITGIEPAPAPGPGEDGSDIVRGGRARWVLEVPRGYTAEMGIDDGDIVDFDRDAREVRVYPGDRSG